MLRTFKPFAVIAALFAAFAAAPSQASLKCQELEANRTCTDNAPKEYVISSTQTVLISAPILPGFSSQCWTWQRQFQCVETEPILSCESGSDFNTVKNNCSLTAAAIAGSVSINSITYITDATYTYRCAFGNFETSQSLPTNKECVNLSTVTVDTASVPAAAPGTAPSTGYGTPPTVAALDSSVVTTQTLTQEYVCYDPPVTTCSDTCYEQVVDKATGKVEQREIPCSAPVSNCVTTADTCTGAVNLDPSGNLTANLAVGPDGRCIKQEETLLCQNGEIPKCLNLENCTLQSSAPSGIQENGVAKYQEQTYVCSNTTKSCAKIASVSNCVHVNAWGWDQMGIKNQVGEGLGEVNQAMAKLEGIQKGMAANDPYIFSGHDRRCHYAIGNWLNTAIMLAIAVAVIVASGGAAAMGMTTGLSGSMSLGAGAEALSTAAWAAADLGMVSATTATTITMNANLIMGAASVASTAMQDAPNSGAFGSDCCKDYLIEGSDAWYKTGCSIDEVKLAVAKRKGLSVYLGEYCSKEDGFPIEQCVEKTRSYCVFDDMLALVVNQQGRAQLDAIANADTSTTQNTGPVNIDLYSPSIANPVKYTGMANGQWVQRANQSHSQIWTWRWPGYCRSQAEQQAAYALFNAEIEAAMNLQGIQPEKMTQAQALEFIAKTANLPSFQECPETPGLMSFLTCSKTDDSCDTAKLPDGPSGASVDLSGVSVSEADVNWRIQQKTTFYLPGDYGVTAVMPTDASYAAVSASINAFVTGTGSCHVAGNCLYQFSITDKLATGGLGARKRTKDYAQFPLYTLASSKSWPTVSYLAEDGTLNAAAYAADPNKGIGTPMVVSTQRFLFHPNNLATAPTGNIHAGVLMDWAYLPTPPNGAQLDSYEPLVVPTSLPPATAGWYPHGNPADNKAHFYISGGCDPNSRWCNYAIEVDLTIQRHPWGSAESPRCWGFSMDQMAALDFDKMDLSQWINSLDLSAASSGLSADAAAAMTAQATQSAQSFYSAFTSGESLTKPGAGTVALVTNTDTLPMLSSTENSSYDLHIALPANWPAWFDDQPNTNPVTNVWVDWGDGSYPQPVPKSSTNRAYDMTHDYGDRPVGTYKVTVMLDTAANGPQTLTTNVRITPNAGSAPKPATLDFNNPGVNGAEPGNYVPSTMPGGNSQAPANLEQLSPGTVEQFDAQGNSITMPDPK